MIGVRGTGRLRFYIAGPMTGLAMFNFPAFFAAEDRLEEWCIDSVNPARHDEEMGWVTVRRDAYGGILGAWKEEGTFDWQTALDWDLDQLSRCDGIYLLPGWTKSRGACKEYHFAVQRGLLVTGAVAEGRKPNATQPLVGLVGYAQAGKDTFAAALGYRRLAFADSLKALALACDPVFPDPASGHALVSGIIGRYGWEHCKAEVPGVREFLQNLGVGVRDILGGDTWVNAALAKYDPAQPTVFTDVRFPNEVAAIRDRGGVIVRVTRIGQAQPGGHVSEQLAATIDPDYEVAAAPGNLDSLTEQAALIDHLLRGAK